MYKYFTLLSVFLLSTGNSCLASHNLSDAFDGLNIKDESTLKGYTSKAENAAVIVYGTSQKDHQTHVLFCYENNKGFWTVPGGKKEKNHISSLDTAANELYEETGAYPHFNPATVKPLLEQQSTKSVFQSVTKQGVQTDLFAFNLDAMKTVSIDDLSNIGNGYLARTQNLGGSFREISQWKILPLSKVRDEFVTNAKSKTADKRLISNMTYYMYNVDGLGQVHYSSYNSLKNFFLQGKLDAIIKPVIVPQPHNNVNNRPQINHNGPVIQQQIIVNNQPNKKPVLEVSAKDFDFLTPSYEHIKFAPSQAHESKNVTLQVMLLKQYQPQGDYAILLRENSNKSFGLLSKNIVDNGQQPLFTSASQFLSKDYGINVGNVIETIPLESLNLFVVYDDTASAAKIGCAWPLNDFLNHLSSGNPIPSTLQCWSRGDGNGNKRKAFTFNAGWMGKLAAELNTNGTDFKIFLR